MKKALILHGTDGSSKDNWFPWLKQELVAKGWDVWAPDLPVSDHPEIERYTKFIFSHKKWQFDGDTSIIGHSSGAVAALGLLQQLPDGIVIDTAYLVGAFKDDLGWEKLNRLFKNPLDFEKIRHHARQFTFIHSDNDPHCPLDHARYLSEQLYGELIIQPGQGHFSTSSDPAYTKFPFLRDLIIRNTLR